MVITDKISQSTYSADFSDWTTCTLKDITSSIIVGGTPSTKISSYYGGDIPWLASAAIHQKHVEEPTTYITNAGLNNSAAKLAPAGSVLIALAGQGKTRGTAALLERDMAINQSLAALVLNEEIDALFIYYLLSSQYENLRLLSSGDSGRGGLSKKLLQNFVVQIPSNLLEQKAISQTLSNLDSLIHSLDRFIKKKRSIRLGSINDLLTRRTRLSGYADQWRCSQLSDLGVFVKGAPLSKADKRSVGKPMILYGELYTTYNEVVHEVVSKTEAQCENKFMSLIGDVILPTSGETAEEISTASCIMLPDVVLAGDLYIYRSHKLDGRFLSYALNHLLNSEIAQIAQGSSVIHVRAKDLGKIFIEFPEIEEQRAIADAIETFDDEIRSLEAERDKWIQIRDGAMEDLLSGRVRLNVGDE